MGSEAPLRLALTLLGDSIKGTGYSGSVQVITGSTTPAPRRFFKFHTAHSPSKFTQIIVSLLTKHPQITLTTQSAKWDPRARRFQAISPSCSRSGQETAAQQAEATLNLSSTHRDTSSSNNVRTVLRYHVSQRQGRPFTVFSSHDQMVRPMRSSE